MNGTCTLYMKTWWTIFNMKAKNELILIPNQASQGGATIVTSHKSAMFSLQYFALSKLQTQ